MNSINQVASSIVDTVSNTFNMSMTTKLTGGETTWEQPLGLFIDGKFVKGKEGKTFEVVKPRNEKPIVSVHEAGPEGMCLYLPNTSPEADQTRCRYRRCRSPQRLARGMENNNSYWPRQAAHQAGGPFRRTRRYHCRHRIFGQWKGAFHGQR